jgi:ectoine hydroxylase-related dioxygenase (phytanoyl-CoA dioxygenase family)
MDFEKMADTSCFDENDAIDMVLEPGQFFIFSDHLLHRSPRNTSARRRLGMSARMAVPSVHIAHDEEPLFAGHKAILLAGEDCFGHLRLTRPPT